MERQQRRFKTGLAKEAIPSDPESLFQDLRRTPEISHLWSHQADILREYYKEYAKKQDVALELPTGAGKTLVGLLLAEYRRKALNERVVYLCPTQQLAYQVGQHAQKYGIGVRVLLRPTYDGINDYYLSNAVGVTTYSSIFNINPRIQDPDTIILDDAHSAEDYIANMWSLNIARQHENNLYGELIELLKPALEDYFIEYVLNEDPTPDVLEKVDMLPIPRFWSYAGAIRNLLDMRLADDAGRYSWSILRGALHACCFFISWAEILVRPMIPPTMMHKHFAQAKHRIYMSATLGKNGELERTTGVPHIERLKMPSELDKQNTGQRLFIFPNMSMDDAQARETTIAAVLESKRALILTPRTSNIPAIEQRFLDAGIDVLKSQDIKRSLETFTSQENAVLVLANRYDGIDLPGDSCRLLILEGLPGGTNLQERFLLTRLAASSLLQDRIRTRLTQGVGRCRRNLNDYCGVLVIGQRILDFCARQEVRSGMSLELQAEIEFGISNSHEMDADGVTDLLRLLYEQGDDWNMAGQEIINLRDAIAMRKFADKDNEIANILLQVVPHEVNFIYDMWKKDYLSALNQAVHVSDGLSHAYMTGYRAWWYYMAGCAAWLAGKENTDDSLIVKAREFFQRAAKDSKSISWFAGLARNLETSSNIEQANIDVIIQCETIAGKLTKLGFTGSKFSKAISELLDLIQSEESILFDRGLQAIGNFFGFESSKPEGEAAPDAVWCFSKDLAIAFEAKREEIASEPVSIKTVRQALTHTQWVCSHRQMKSNARIFVIVVTSRSSIKTEAKQNAHDLYYIHPKSIYNIAISLAAALRRVRNQTTPTNGGEIAQAIQEELLNSQLLLPTIISTLTANRLNTLSEVP